MTLPCLSPLLVCSRPGTLRPVKGGIAGAGTPRGLGTSPWHLQLCQEDRAGGRLCSRAALQRAGVGGGQGREAEPSRGAGRRRMVVFASVSLL